MTTRRDIQAELDRISDQIGRSLELRRISLWALDYALARQHVRPPV